MFTWNKDAKDNLKLVVIFLSCNTWRRALSPEELILGPWTRLPGQAPTAGRGSQQSTGCCHSSHRHLLGAQDCDHLPSAGHSNFFIPFLRALTLPAFPAGPEPCGTYLSQTRPHLPLSDIQQCLPPQREGKGRPQTPPVLDFALPSPRWCISSEALH